jgi:ketosteroid isomerase-like protein
MNPSEFVTEMLACSDEGRFDSFRDHLAAECDWRNPMGHARGPDEIVALLAGYAEAFSERRHELALVLEADSMVAVEGEWIATHTGPLSTLDGDIPPTGRTVRVPFAAVMHVRDGRVASNHVYLDPLGFMAQLGLAPAPAAA